MPTDIPGHPTMIVQAMPGAGGARAASYLYKAAARDGSVIGGIHGAVLTAPLLNPGAADFDVTKFSWIGNVTRDKYIGYVWHKAPGEFPGGGAANDDRVAGEQRAGRRAR